MFVVSVVNAILLVIQVQSRNTLCISFNELGRCIVIRAELKFDAFQMFFFFVLILFYGLLTFNNSAVHFKRREWIKIGFN